MSVITLEVLSNESKADDPKEDNCSDSHEIKSNGSDDADVKNELRSISEKTYVSDKTEINDNSEASDEGSIIRNVLMEYVTRKDGSVVCKTCGEILQTRTHWYRHKYKHHIAQPLNPAPLFQCEQCLVFFKSRKGYIGHIASRHSDLLADSTPILSSSQTETIVKESSPGENPSLQEVKQDSDPELSIPKSSVPNYNTVVKQNSCKPTSEMKKTNKRDKGNQTITKADWEEKRCQEEKLVADIIDRVRRECEAQAAQGSGGPMRRGYTRRTTVMHT